MIWIVKAVFIQVVVGGWSQSMVMNNRLEIIMVFSHLMSFTVSVPYTSINFVFFHLAFTEKSHNYRKLLLTCQVGLFPQTLPNQKIPGDLLRLNEYSEIITNHHNIVFRKLPLDISFLVSIEITKLHANSWGKRRAQHNSSGSLKKV